jgi:hypothetical protein
MELVPYFVLMGLLGFGLGLWVESRRKDIS